PLYPGKGQKNGYLNHEKHEKHEKKATWKSIGIIILLRMQSLCEHDGFNASLRKNLTNNFFSKVAAPTLSQFS
ncbi:MAG: hypothetical protein QMD09_08900, partial [Desulfatibacillaceae bacterium]|nr:hypothetical protein [Desulfatibacillaceae bacterium]